MPHQLASGWEKARPNCGTSEAQTIVRAMKTQPWHGGRIHDRPPYEKGGLRFGVGECSPSLRDYEHNIDPNAIQA
jgi:hypothetical protein